MTFFLLSKLGMQNLIFRCVESFIQIFLQEETSIMTILFTFKPLLQFRKSLFHRFWRKNTIVSIYFVQLYGRELRKWEFKYCIKIFYFKWFRNLGKSDYFQFQLNIAC